MIADNVQTIAVILVVAGAVGYLLVALRRWGRGESKCSQCCCARGIPFLEEPKTKKGAGDPKSTSTENPGDKPSSDGACGS